MTTDESDAQGVTFQEIADWCHWCIKGYRDGEPGTAEDIRERLNRLEQFDRQNLARISQLEKVEKEYEAEVARLRAELDQLRDEKK